MKILIIFLLCFLFNSCQSIFTFDDDSDYKSIVDFGREARKKYDMQLVGVGGGSSKGLESFNLTFLGNEVPSLEEARILFYNLSKGFLDKINTDKKLKEKLNVDQFTIVNLDLGLMFPDVVGQIRFVTNGYVDRRSPLQLVYFFYHDSVGHEPMFVHEEPYEELKRIVEAQFPCQF